MYYVRANSIDVIKIKNLNVQTYINKVFQIGQKRQGGTIK